MHLTDGGLETELIFNDGIDLPCFAAFPLVDDDAGCRRLQRYYTPYIDIATRAGVGFAAGAPTWRASADWGAMLGYDAAGLARVNARAIEVMRDIVRASGAEDAMVSGSVGPRGDAYRPGARMSPGEARRYHAPQLDALAAGDADLVTAMTLTYADEAIGIARAASDAGVPVGISFTVETDGRLPDGTGLGEAIDRVDDATGGGPAWFGVNCAHPDHLLQGLEPGAAWLARIGAIRGNASRLSHTELERASGLDAGDPGDFGASHLPLRELLPAVEVLGGCCGTDARHVAALIRAWRPEAAPRPEGRTP